MDHEDVSIGELYRLMLTMRGRLDALLSSLDEDRRAYQAFLLEQREFQGSMCARVEALERVVVDCPRARAEIVSQQLNGHAKTVALQFQNINEQLASAKWFFWSVLVLFLGGVGAAVWYAVRHAIAGG